MAQSKQTSFGNGEVSPEIHFLSNDPSYANSLSKLNNGFVRYMGGVSNRSGSEQIVWNPYSADPDFPSTIEVSQVKVPEPGGDESIVGFSYWNSVHEEWDVLEVGYFSFEITPAVFVTKIGYRVNYGGITAGGLPVQFYAPVFTEPSTLRFLVVKDKILITPNFVTPQNFGGEGMGTNKSNYYLDMGSRKMKEAENPSVSSFLPATGITSAGSYGKAPWYPVSYLITGTNINDEEIILENRKTEGYDASTWNPQSATPPAGGTWYYPHADLYTNIVMYFIGSAKDYFKYISLYRAMGAADLGGSVYKLVSRAKPTSDTSITLTDQGEAASIISPPIDYSFMVASSNFSYEKYKVSQVSCATYYQQRLICAYKNSGEGVGFNLSFEVKAGTMMASRIGSPFMLSKPLIISETEAFQFSTPISDGSEVVGFLSMERLVALTERAIYGYMGGDNGVFSPLTLNPIKLSDTGCSRTIEPKTVSGRGYYVSSDQTKVMGVTWENDKGFRIFEASKYASHLLTSGVRKIEILAGKEDQLVILRRDGVVVIVTINTEGDDLAGAAGFSTFEVSGGFVESIYKTRMKKNYVFNQLNTDQVDMYYDSIVMYVIRDGYRTIEVLKPREEDYPQNFCYSDMSAFFGYRLADNGLAGYKKIYHQPHYQLPLNSLDVDFHLNLGDETTTGWGPEDTIPLYSAKKLFIGKVIFYYGDDKYPKKFTYTITPDSEVATADPDFPFKYSGYVNSDVPEDYRDVLNSPKTTAEKNEFWTRWCPAITQLSNDARIGNIYYSEVSKYSDERVPVSVYADSQVLSSPNNPHKQNIICYIYRDEWGSLVMDIPEGFDCGWGVVGLPYTFEMISMRLEPGADDNSLQSARKLINQVGVGVKNTQGGFIGIPEYGLTDLQEMDAELNPDMSELPKPQSGYYEWTIPTEFTEEGKVCIKHVDPTPITVLALYPAGIASGG